MTPDHDFTRELYPFLYAPSPGDEQSATALLDSVRSSTLAKCADVMALRAELLAEYEEQFGRAAQAMADRFVRGGKLLAFGNGGSATDADDATADCMSPPRAGWRALPALSLPADSATVTAVANDVGLESVFARQLGAVGERGDIALGISTSGNSGNVVAAFAEAKRRGMLTVALTGYDGGAIARSNTVDFCFVARREFVPRIQEGHATLWHALLDLVQDVL
ncbi:MAG: SIS domain-containing protein, partial [Gemmatimonadota bacterium]|nr:SIS domain-containing protein [Gemmatimonadota bacterium]